MSNIIKYADFIIKKTKFVIAIITLLQPSCILASATHYSRTLFIETKYNDINISITADPTFGAAPLTHFISINFKCPTPTIIKGYLELILENRRYKYFELQCNNIAYVDYNFTFGNEGRYELYLVIEKTAVVNWHVTVLNTI